MAQQTSHGKKRPVVVVGYNGAELVDIACVTTALDLANRLGAHCPYAVMLATVGGSRYITCETGLTLGVQADLCAVSQIDTLVISGGGGHVAAARNRVLIREVRRLALSARRVASVCTGATVLAEAGLLNGRRATTHWFYASELASAYPQVTVDASPIFIRDGQVATSGGVTASLDLTLALIQEDHGAELARRVARGMVTYLQRPGSQAQTSVFTASRRPDDATVPAVVDHILANPDADLRAETLASQVGVSTRQLNRLLHEHLGEPPGALVRRIRLELTAQLVATTDLPLSQVARRCGFGSGETLRQAFVAKFGVSPRTFRQTQPREFAPAEAS